MSRQRNFIVSPIPAHNKFPNPIDDFTVPDQTSASVIPICKGQSSISANWLYAATAKNTSEAFTLILYS